MASEEDHAKLVADLGREARCIAGRDIYFDWEGFFWDPNDWNEEAAQILARESGLEELTEAHWKVLRFFREYYFYHGRAPDEPPFESGHGHEPGGDRVSIPGRHPAGRSKVGWIAQPEIVFLKWSYEHERSFDLSRQCGDYFPQAS